MPTVRPLLLAGALALAGCATVPDLGPRPQPTTPETLATTRSFAAPVVDWPADRWWTVYGDPQLDALMEEALAGAPDLAEAAARVRAAEAQARQARSATLPGVSARAEAAETKQSANNGIPPAFVPRGYHDTGRASLDIAYDLDLWGRNRAALASATSEAEAARMDAAEARLVLTTGLVAAYADFARLTAEHAAAVAALRNRDASTDLVSRRVAGGAANRGEAAQARAAAAEARQDLAALEEDLAVVRNRIAALVGAGPDRGLSLSTPKATAGASFGLPQTLAIELVGRRPDLQAARLRAEAAARRIEVAKAGFYPNVSLAALVGVQALGLDDLARSGSGIGQAGVALNLPIFDGGRLDGAYRGARADYDSAVAAYNGALLGALRQTADAVAGRRALDTRLAAARESLDAGEAAYRVAQLRYEGGLTSYLTLLTAEDAVIAQRRAVAQLEARGLALDAALVRALGGGFRA